MDVEKLMNSRQRRKFYAEKHNYKLEQEREFAQDKIDNPEKYPQPKLSKKAGKMLAMLAGLGALSGR